MRLTITLHCDTIQGRTDCTASMSLELGKSTPSVDVAARAAGWDVRPIGLPGGGQEVKAFCPDCAEILMGLAVKAMSDQYAHDITRG